MYSYHSSETLIALFHYPTTALQILPPHPPPVRRQCLCGGSASARSVAIPAACASSCGVRRGKWFEADDTTRNPGQHMNHGQPVSKGSMGRMSITEGSPATNQNPVQSAINSRTGSRHITRVVITHPQHSPCLPLQAGCHPMPGAPLAPSRHYHTTVRVCLTAARSRSMCGPSRQTSPGPICHRKRSDSPAVQHDKQGKGGQPGSESSCDDRPAPGTFVGTGHVSWCSLQQGQEAVDMLRVRCSEQCVDPVGERKDAGQACAMKATVPHTLLD